MSAAASTASYPVYNTPEVNSGTTTSWIPLTTAWPSQSGCASSFFLYPGQPAAVAWDPGYGYFAGGTPDCLPPEATTWHEQAHQNGDGFTSLSIRPIVCPAAFTTAASSVQSGSSTLVLCCPSGYDLQGGQPGRAIGSCISSLTSGQTITYLATASGGQFTQTSLPITKSTTISAIDLMGWNIDEATSASSSSSASGSSSSTSSSATSTSQSSSSGLSTGAKAGIGVGVALGTIGILSLITAIILFRRRPRTAQGDRGPVQQVDAVPPRPMYEMGYDAQHSELHHPPSELASSPK